MDFVGLFKVNASDSLRFAFFIQCEALRVISPAANH